MPNVTSRDATTQGPRLGDEEAVGDWRRVLVVRCCRMPQFRAAVERLIAAHPGVRIWALTDSAYEDDVRRAGAHEVILHCAKRIGPGAIGTACLRALRSIGVQAVVLPIMDDSLEGSANLLRLAAAIGAPQTAISPHGTRFCVLDRRRVRRLAIAQTVRIPESAIVLGQMLRALLAKRRRARPRAGKTRVLHIINSLGLGGAQTQCAALIDRTPTDRYEVSVLVLASDEPNATGRFEKANIPVTALRRSLEGETPITAIEKHCREGAYDVVHTWLPLANMYGSAGARLAGIPRIVTSVRSLNPGWYPQWCQWWYRPGDVIAARLADAVTVNASPLVRDHGRWALCPPERITVIPNGLAPHEPDADAAVWLRGLVGVPVDTPLLGHVGRLAIEKDQATFLRALAILDAQGLAFHAVLVGDGPTEASLRATVDALNLVPRVTFMGARKDARRVIAGLDLLVLTSTIEGFPNVLLEAAMLGVPLVSSRVGGVIDLVDDPTALFPPSDPGATAATIRAALEDRHGTATRAERLRHRSCAEFNADRMVQRWLSLYDADPHRTVATSPGSGAALAVGRSQAV